MIYKLFITIFMILIFMISHLPTQALELDAAALRREAGSPGGQLKLAASPVGLTLAVGGKNLRTLDASAPVHIIGSDEDDWLTIDLSQGRLAAPVTFDGGGQTTERGDGMTFIGDGTNEAIYEPDPAQFGDGVVTVDGVAVRFTGLEPVAFVSVLTASLTTTTGPTNITISNGVDFNSGTLPAVVVTGTVNGVAFEAFSARNCSTVSITSTAASASDTIIIESANNAHGNVNLLINTSGGADSVTVNGTAQFGSNVTISTQQIYLAANPSITVEGQVSLNAGAGEIVDTSEAEGVIINAFSLAMRAGTGIGPLLGDASDIDVSVSGLAAQSETGYINIQGFNAGCNVNATEIDGLTGVTLVNAQDFEKIILRANTAADFKILAPVQALVDGDIIIAQLGTSDGKAVIVTDDILANSGNIFLYSGTHLFFGDDGDFTIQNFKIAAKERGGVFAGAGEVHALFGVNAPGNADGDIVMAGQCTVETENGNVGFKATRFIDLTRIITSPAPDAFAFEGNVFIKADSDGDLTGEVADKLAGEGPNITAPSIIIEAGSGIGDRNFDNINTQTGELRVSSNQGDIMVMNNQFAPGPLILNGAASEASTKGIYITNSGTLKINGEISTPGLAELFADDIVIFDRAEAVAGSGLQFFAGNSIVVQAGAEVTDANFAVDFPDDDPGVGGSISIQTNLAGTCGLSGGPDPDTISVRPCAAFINADGGEPAAAPGDTIIVSDFGTLAVIGTAPNATYRETGFSDIVAVNFEASQIVTDCNQNGVDDANEFPLVVTNRNDSGAGSLRDNIILANCHPGADVITFDLPPVFGDNSKSPRKAGIPDTSPNIPLNSGPFADIIEDLEIIGPAIKYQAIINGNDEFRPFVVADGVSLTLRDLILIGANTGLSVNGNGGAILSIGGNITLEDCEISGSEAADHGGAIYSENGSLTLDNCRFAQNEADNDGGAIYKLGGALTIRNSSFERNEAQNGGALFADAGGLIVNSTFTSNFAEIFGGGVYAGPGSGTFRLVNCTLTLNESDRFDTGTGDGGGVADPSGGVAVTMINTIVAGNLDQSGAGDTPDIFGAVQSLGHNLVGSVGATNFASNTIGDIYGDPLDTTSPGVDALERDEPVDARLAPISFTPTPAIIVGDNTFHRLRPGSLAINRGDNAAVTAPDFTGPPFTDQRGEGFPRIIEGTVDMGAVESPAPGDTIIVTIAEDEDDGNMNPDDISLREAILLANSIDREDRIEFAIPGPAPYTITLTQGPLPPLSDHLRIRGTGAPQDIVIDGNNAVQPFIISNSVLAVLAHLTITRGFDQFAFGDGGGAILNNGGELIILGCHVTNNQSVTLAGGIRNKSGSLTMDTCVVSGNSSEQASGGILASNNASVTIRNSAIFNNKGNFGAGITLNGTSALAVNSTISGNSAAGNGGGIFVGGGIGLLFRLVNCTVTENTADDDNNGTGDGGGLAGGSYSLLNTIVAGNTDRGGQLPDVQTGLASEGHNLIGNVGTLNFTANTTGDQYGDPNNTTTPNAGATEFPFAVNPQLHPLADWGGLTPTHALDLFSIAINAGDNTAIDEPLFTGPSFFDQRGPGFPRIIESIVDIGAYESEGIPPPQLPLIVDTTDDVDNGNFLPGDRSLREAITLANIHFGIDEITFDIPSPAPHLIVLSASLPVNADELRIIGPGARHDLVIDGDLAFRPFDNGLDTSMTLRALTVARGNTDTTGGGIRNAGRLTLEDCAITSNTSVGRGGGVYTSGEFGRLIVSDCEFSGNEITGDGNDGAGIALLDANSASITRSLIAHNRTTQTTGSSGGGLFAFYNLTGLATKMNVEDCWIHSNYCFNNGGGIYAESVGLTVRNSAVTGNTAGGNGGGVAVFGNDANVTIVNATISGNQANDNGGGVGVRFESPNIQILHSTITGNTCDADNSSAGDGGGIHRNAGTVLTSNSIIAANTDLGGQTPDIHGEVGSLGYNLIGNVGTAVFSANTTGDLYGDPGGTSPVNAGATRLTSEIDPKLAPLAQNGGLTPTHALLFDSFAFNFGDESFNPNAFSPPLTTDQRGAGFARVSLMRIDKGAFEANVPTAICRNVTVFTQSIPADVDPAQVDDGSFDLDGPIADMQLSPAGPYPEGDTDVLLIVFDEHGFSNTCQATITVVKIEAHGWMLK